MLAPCSPAITDKMARHATSWDRILQPELPAPPPAPGHLSSAPGFGTPCSFTALLVNHASC